MACELYALPGGELGEDLLGERLAAGFEAAEFLIEGNATVGGEFPEFLYPALKLDYGLLKIEFLHTIQAPV
jgi:hypothetical protein